MAFVVNVGRRETDAPEGRHAAKCVDVINLGLQVNKYDKKKEEKIHQVEVCWLLALKNPRTGRNYYAAKVYTVSLSPRARLRQDIEGCLSKELEPSQPFDLESLIGKTCTLTIEAKTSQWSDAVFTNVVRVEPVDDCVMIETESYTRQAAPVAPQQETTSVVQISDEDLPF